MVHVRGHKRSVNTVVNIVRRSTGETFAIGVLKQITSDRIFILDNESGLYESFDRKAFYIKPRS
jgi:Na+-transporting NADH:ubiquinone oxidoreductase subunit NqrA